MNPTNPKKNYEPILPRQDFVFHKKVLTIESKMIVDTENAYKSFSMKSYYSEIKRLEKIGPFRKPISTKFACEIVEAAHTLISMKHSNESTI